MSTDIKHLTERIKARILEYEGHVVPHSTGVVLTVGDGIARVSGLSGAVLGEKLQFSGGASGIAFNLNEDTVGAVVLGDTRAVKEGDRVTSTGEVLQVPVGASLVGRVVNSLGEPVDGRGPVHSTETRPVESPSPGISERQPVRTPLHTGVKAIDSMVPIGRGQRELIIGDRETGKTSIAIDAIVNQKGTGVICVYVAIGVKASSVARTVQALRDAGAMDHTIVVSAPSSEPAPMQYLAPFSGCAMAEYFMYRGGDTLVVYDDLVKHAMAYRAMSLLLRRPPGREAYPGDIFYLHSRLLERSAKLADALGGGSMTALPIAQTLAGDISAYIPTNIISITDGQIYLESDLFFAGVRPAINVGLSVSRVGGSAQTAGMRKVAGRLRLELAQYRELAAFARFATDLDRSTRRRLVRGERIVEVLKQPRFRPMPVEHQVAVIYAAVSGYLDRVPVRAVRRFEDEFIDFLVREHPEVVKAIQAGDVAGPLDRALSEFDKHFVSEREEPY